MRVERVGSVDSSTARNSMMEVWLMSVSQRFHKDIQDRISGTSHEPRERKVEPAARVEISKEARKLDERNS